MNTPDTERPKRLHRQRGTVPYIELCVQLDGCVTDVDDLLNDLTAWLDQYLPHDFDSDIEVTLVRSAGLHDPRFPTEPERKGQTDG